MKFDNANLLHSDGNSGVALENQICDLSAFFYQEDSEEIYVGGINYVLKIDLEGYRIIEVGVFE